MKLNREFDPIRDWANQRGIYLKGDTKTQLLKLVEEVGELSKAILNKDSVEVKDAIGDIVIVLTNLTVLANKDIFISTPVTIEDCINEAYNVIKNRTGKMENGTFKKD